MDYEEWRKLNEASGDEEPVKATPVMVLAATLALGTLIGLIYQSGNAKKPHDPAASRASEKSEYNPDQLQAIQLLNSLPAPRCQRGGWAGTDPVMVWWTCDYKFNKITISNGHVTKIEGD